jgi:hypothetical protein
MPSEPTHEVIDWAQKRAEKAPHGELGLTCASARPSALQRELALAVLAALAYGRGQRGAP